MLKKSMLSKPIEAMLNEAVQSELYAAHLYRHLANQLQSLGYFGAQKHFLSESADEVSHYQKHADFLNDRGTVAKVPMIEAIDDKVASLYDALAIAFDTEQALERDYARYYKAAADDPITQQYLLEFLEIQRKSVGEYGDLLARLARVADDAAGLLMIDNELGA